ncbi:MAG: SPOR domain-containing protein, partial [Gemmatimonadota bacterium]
TRATKTGTIPGAAADFWLVTGWVPRDRARAATAAAESASLAQDSMLVQDQDSSTVKADSTALYLQVSSSQNADWSAELIKQLKAGGFPAMVLAPSTADEGYRVVVGPYPTRDAAEEVGRKLGRPYFILTNPPIKR